MGIFAFYNGFIYNEFFAIPLELASSCYNEEISVLSVSDSANILTLKDFGYNKYSDNCVYPFGVDSRWA